MARLKIARTGTVLLILLCSTAGYLVHTFLLRDPTPSNPLTTEPLRQLKKYVDWSWPPRQESPAVQAAREKKEAERLIFGKDGLVRNWEDGLDEKVKGYSSRSSRVRYGHPIYRLIEEGQNKWAKLLERQPKTLPQAVSEYKRRYGRPPPKGFEQWWKFARRNGIKIVDDYDQIHRDLEPFFALSPKVFRQRRDELAKEPHSYEIILDPKGKSHTRGVRGSSHRPLLLFGLLEPIAQYLPNQISFHGSDHDLGSTLLGDDQRQAAFKAVKEKKYLTEDELRRFEEGIGKRKVKGTVAACPEGSLAWNQSLIKQEGGIVPGVEPEATFIHNPIATYDFCSNPTHLQTHGSFSFDFARSSVLRPLFQWSKQLRSPSILTTPLEAYINHTSPHAANQFTPWENKTENKVFWRGSSTGDAYTKNKNTEGGWQMSHRPRLALMAQAQEGLGKIWVRRGKEWRLEEWTRKRLNEEYLDIGLTGHPHQCDQEDGTCKEMDTEIKWLERVSPEDAAKFKYAFDVDGNGWSSRFHRLMMSGSVVLKSTIYPEWISDWIIPWVHYVPVQVDYSDLYNIMSFFSGAPSHDGTHAGREVEGGNDDMARAIAEAARKFGEEHWRWEDMQGYMFRLLLEYSRLLADDRDAASYHRHKV